MIRVKPAMPRFYFHLHNDVDSLDEEGRELPDLRAASQAALQDARQMAAESVMNGHLNLHHYVEVTDEQGQPVLHVAFGEVVKILDEHDAEKSAN